MVRPMVLDVAKAFALPCASVPDHCYMVKVTPFLQRTIKEKYIKNNTHNTNSQYRLTFMQKLHQQCTKHINSSSTHHAKTWDCTSATCKVARKMPRSVCECSCFFSSIQSLIYSNTIKGTLLPQIPPSGLFQCRS